MSSVRKLFGEFTTDEDWLNFIESEAAKNPRGQPLEWKSPNVKPMPRVMENPTTFWYGDDLLKVGEQQEIWVHNSMVWFLEHLAGTAKYQYQVVEPLPTEGNEYVGEGRKHIKTYTGIPTAIPNSVVRAICLNLGMYEEDRRSYGASWTLYKRT